MIIFEDFLNLGLLSGVKTGNSIWTRCGLDVTLV